MKLPRDIFFGPDSLESFDPTVLDITSGDRILILFSKTVLKFRETSRFIGKLKEVATILTEPVKAEPSDKEIGRLVEKYMPMNIKIIIGIGGGSVLDCAKGVAYGLGRQNVSLVSIPTTAGSGSEITDRFVVVTVGGQKKAILNPSLVPDIVILEPALLQYLPDGVRLHSLIDAISHAVESIYSKKINSVGRQAARLALETIKDNYDQYLSDKGNLKVGAEIQLAAMNAGLSLVNGGANVVHAFAYAINEQLPMSHGQSVSLSLYVCAKIFNHWKEFPWINDLLTKNRPMIFNIVAKDFNISRCLQSILDNKRLIDNSTLQISKDQLSVIVREFYEAVKTK